MNKEEALKYLGIEIPEGYEFVKYDYPQDDDYLLGMGGTAKISGDPNIIKYIIIKEKIETDCWYFARFERESYPIYLSVDGDFYQMISYKGIGECKVTSEFEIISKMEAVK